MMRLRFPIMMVLLLGLTVSGLYAQETPGLPTNGLIAFVSNHEGNHEIYVIDPQGEGLRNLTNNAARDCCPVWSPDGRQLAFESNRDHHYGDIFVMDADGSHVRNLTNSNARDTGISWSPDGRHIAFMSDRDHHDGDVFVVDVDGSRMRNLTDRDTLDGYPSWSPDGQSIAFVSSRDMHAQYPGVDIFIMNADGSMVRNLTRNEMVAIPFGWSPGGDYIVYVVNYVMNVDETGFDVFIANTSGDVVLRNVSNRTDPGWVWFPAWSPDGAYLAYLAQYDEETMGLRIKNASGMLIHDLYPHEFNVSQFAWSPDGHFIAALYIDSDGGLSILSLDNETVVELTTDVLYVGSEGIELAFRPQLDWQPVFAAAD